MILEAFIDNRMTDWISKYLRSHIDALKGLDPAAIERLAQTLRDAHARDAQIFVFGNGGSAANASHFATDLGKGASDVLGAFRVISLNDNTAWMTAIGNDYNYEDVFLRQLKNYGKPGDIAITMSVSGSSPNLVRAMTWAKENGLTTIGLLGGKRGKLEPIVDQAIVAPSEHYGRVEDCHMTILHMVCYAFMEKTVGAP